MVFVSPLALAVGSSEAFICIVRKPEEFLSDVKFINDELKVQIYLGSTTIFAMLAFLFSGFFLVRCLKSGDVKKQRLV